MASPEAPSSVDGIDLSNLKSGSRARKSVKRMRADENTVPSGSKPTLNVLEGPGTEVKKLTNVSKHLEAVAGDKDLLKTLHRLMYGKFAKHDVVLSNIMRFSGLPFRDATLFPRGYDESYDSLLFRVNDLKMSTLRSLFDAVGLEREPESFDDGKADKVNLVGRFTNWLETPKDVKAAAASSQLLQLLGASSASGGDRGAPAAALLKHLKRPRRHSTDGLSDGESDAAIDGSGAVSPGSATDASGAQLRPAHPDAPDAHIADHIESLVRSTTNPTAMTMTALLRRLSREFGIRMLQRGVWVAGVLKDRFFAADPLALGLASENGK